MELLKTAKRTGRKLTAYLTIPVEAHIQCSVAMRQTLLPCCSSFHPNGPISVAADKKIDSSGLESLPQDQGAVSARGRTLR